MANSLRPRTQPLIPRRDEDLFTFATVMDVTIQDATYNLPVGTKATLSANRLLFNNDLFRISRPKFSTPTNIQLKNESRQVLITQLRMIIRTLKANFRASLNTQDQLLAVGINTPKLTISQEPAPRYAPGLLLVSQTRSFATLKLIQTTNRGSNTNTRLPVGVQNVQLLQKTINNELHLIRSFTKPVVRVPLEHYAPGSDIVVAVRYLGARGEPGPISQSLTIHVPASPVVPS